MPARTILAAAVLGLCAATSPAADEAPTPRAMQEAFDLSEKRKKLLLELELTEKRLAQLEKEQFAKFERVADPLGSEYWESVSDMVLRARARQDFKAGELLLYHAPGIYRVKDAKPKLTTKGECWYFKPDRDVRKGEEFTITLVYDAPEEIALAAKGFFPQTDRARDPARPYNTEIGIPYRPKKR